MKENAKIFIVKVVRLNVEATLLYRFLLNFPLRMTEIIQ